MKKIEFPTAEQWVDEFADFLYAFAIKRVNSKEEAEDLVQETFFCACKGYEQFKGECSLKTWLTKILKNKIIDYYRKKSSNQKYEVYLSDTEESFENAFFDENNYGRWKENIHKNYVSENTDSYVLSKEFYHILEFCLQKLPPKLKPVFIAKYILDEDAEKICKEFNITPSNYWTLLFRSKTLLRSCLEKNEINP
ncbi:RNA polymerase sigma-70 factor (ECF subfamily) [Chryseobacterium ginsenosidimutans]|uniref:sigma-70 family RNA polymerase sigma factor n=1 Tax=Chryseobacterium ginsenosidimutans TaxID=687846 RepID=UPI002169CEAF|nr:sigma-70 family RNA polymerase sigma factor [Chryseobacterium ginsenosidimutans]MCS3871564.1 RNA polymerase sigma-70 factor (ECF subfamily) [Chryseobacterium ginsenosidimutans]